MVLILCLFILMRFLGHYATRLCKGKLYTACMTASIALIKNVGGIWGIYMKELHTFFDCICGRPFQARCNANPQGFQDKKTAVATIKNLQWANSNSYRTTKFFQTSHGEDLH